MNGINLKIFEPHLRKNQIIYWIIASIALLISQIIPYIIISFAMSAAGVTIFFVTILIKEACQKYDNTFNFTIGIYVGFMISIFPAIVLKEMISNWILIIIISCFFGGYLSLMDIAGNIMKTLNAIENYILTGLTVLGLLMGGLVSLLFFSLILSIFFAIFGLSLDNTYLLFISFLLVNLTIVDHMGRMVFSKDMGKLEYHPFSKGVFGSFLGGLIGIACSLTVGFLYIYYNEISSFILWVGTYTGLVTGTILGFFMGYRVE